MTTTIRAHFDGKHFVPHKPVVGLAPGDAVEVVHVSSSSLDASGPEAKKSVLRWLAEHPTDDAGLPSDLSHEHDHYLWHSQASRLIANALHSYWIALALQRDAYHAAALLHIVGEGIPPTNGVLADRLNVTSTGFVSPFTPHQSRKYPGVAQIAFG